MLVRASTRKEGQYGNRTEQDEGHLAGDRDGQLKREAPAEEIELHLGRESMKRRRKERERAIFSSTNYTDKERVDQTYSLYLIANICAHGEVEYPIGCLNLLRMSRHSLLEKCCIGAKITGLSIQENGAVCEVKSGFGRADVYRKDALYQIREADAVNLMLVVSSLEIQRLVPPCHACKLQHCHACGVVQISMV